MHLRAHDDKDSVISTIAGSILGLAAFVLALTFAIVSDRYDTRKSLVRDDAIAIRTAWQRANFLPDAERAERSPRCAGEICRGGDSRTGGDVPGRGATASGSPVEHGGRERTQGHELGRRRADIDSLNEVIGIHVARVAVGIQARVPREIWLVLYSVTILGMVAVGYQTGVAGSKRGVARPLIGFSFALVYALIAARDRPDSGLLTVTQQPPIALYDSMGKP
jgi:hypothetical protein